MYKSTDAGGSWAPQLTLYSATALAIDPTTPTTVYAGTEFNGVLKSTDGGSTWHALNTGLTNLNVHGLAIDPLAPRRLYAGTDAGVFAIERVQDVSAEHDGCAVTPRHRSGAASWLLVPVLPLLCRHARRRRPRPER